MICGECQGVKPGTALPTRFTTVANEEFTDAAWCNGWLRWLADVFFFNHPRLFSFVGGNKFVNRDTGLLDSAPESADGKFFVPGDDATLVFPAQHDMTSFLAGLMESEFFECLDGFIA
jgi:hypothetical protein